MMNGEIGSPISTPASELGGVAAAKGVPRRARRLPRRRWVVAAVAVGAAAVVGVGWALVTVLSPAEDPLAATPFTFVAVQSGEVGASIRLNVVADWASIPVGVNQAAGVVTGVVVGAGDEVKQGTVLYRVNERPVVIAQGTVPAYRNLGEGAVGADVSQLQTMLAAAGVFGGSAEGTYGSGTTAAVRAWQKALGVEQTGVVGRGDVIFVPTLPTRITLDRDIITRGASLSGGEEAVQGLSAAPTFVIPVTTEQATRIPAGTVVKVMSPEGDTWVAVAADHVTDTDTQDVRVNLAGVDDQTICADACAQVPVVGQSLLPSEIVIVPSVSGLVVPSAALITDAGGQIAVIDETGTRIPVTVVESASGMSVVEGVDEGVKVRIPAASADS